MLFQSHTQFVICVSRTDEHFNTFLLFNEPHIATDFQSFLCCISQHPLRSTSIPDERFLRNLHISCVTAGESLRKVDFCSIIKRKCRKIMWPLLFSSAMAAPLESA